MTNVFIPSKKLKPFIKTSKQASKKIILNILKVKALSSSSKDNVFIERSFNIIKNKTHNAWSRILIFGDDMKLISEARPIKYNVNIKNNKR